MIVRLLSHHSCPLVSVNYYTQKRRSRLHCSARDTDIDQMQILTKYQGNESFPKLTFKSELLRTEIRTGLFMFGNFSSMRGQTAKNATEMRGFSKAFPLFDLTQRTPCSRVA